MASRLKLFGRTGSAVGDVFCCWFWVGSDCAQAIAAQARSRRTIRNRRISLLVAKMAGDRNGQVYIDGPARGTSGAIRWDELQVAGSAALLRGTAGSLRTALRVDESGDVPGFLLGQLAAGAERH